jgi:hypothetical protein
MNTVARLWPMSWRWDVNMCTERYSKCDSEDRQLFAPWSSPFQTDDSEFQEKNYSSVKLKSKCLERWQPQTRKQFSTQPISKCQINVNQRGDSRPLTSPWRLPTTVSFQNYFIGWTYSLQLSNWRPFAILASFHLTGTARRGEARPDLSPSLTCREISKNGPAI